LPECLGKAIEFGLPQENVDKEKMVGRLQRENFERAVKGGAEMAFGTDAGVYPHGDNAKQFFYMVKYGMTPAQAIRAATSSAADLSRRHELLQPEIFAHLHAFFGHRPPCLNGPAHFTRHNIVRRDAHFLLSRQVPGGDPIVSNVEEKTCRRPPRNTPNVC